MKKTKYEALKKICNRAENNLTAATDRLAMEMQPYFKSEITVFYQPSDGFVVLPLDTDTAGRAPSNLGIDEVFETICKDPEFYLN